MQGRVEFVIKALEEAQVRYLIVGGVAVVLHGHLRTTLDLDLVIHLERENLERALAALAGLGFEPQAPVPLALFADPERRRSWVREKNMTVFSLWNPKLQGFAVDLFVEEPFDFDVVFARAVRVELPTTAARVVALSDLLALKRSAAREQDLLDIEAFKSLGRES